MGDAQALEMPAKLSGPDSSVVKSAGRVLQILEYFDTVQREACVSEVSRALRCPQSSTSVLLRSLVSLGYLQNDRYRRTFFPTRRVCLLGNWVDPALVRQGEMLMWADELASRSKQTVIIANINGLHAQYIYVNRQESDVIPLAASVGAQCSLARTALGKSLLAGHTDKYVAQLVRRINAERAEDEATIDIAALLAELQQGRTRGWFVGEGSDKSRAGMAAVLDRKDQLISIGIDANGALSPAEQKHYCDLLTQIPVTSDAMIDQIAS